jgi:hypothetical protein
MLKSLKYSCIKVKKNRKLQRKSFKQTANKYERKVKSRYS